MRLQSTHLLPIRASRFGRYESMPDVRENAPGRETAMNSAVE
jgi:hypothetical protein